MDNWFTIEQIDRDTFSISEYKHWEETHCYLLCGEKYAILIDTGLGVSNIRKIVDSLTKLPVMTVTTHVHWDHIGGHKYFDNIAVHEAEKDWLRLSRQSMKRWGAWALRPEIFWSHLWVWATSSVCCRRK